ncbi:MAG: UDP-N-acetylmuramoyl-tripeptide--D-alanyl-D-alanine ligase [Victivallales bacterium]|jgi:UDP-N-acetylmuramoyl-tripeptide--D-alanyl-D-alanine ligase|nr:UDP-N-acetylmuramoyl-tripeptide--D-alanyl-D-alanine ligase [Victivallales bacterium]
MNDFSNGFDSKALAVATEGEWLRASMPIDLRLNGVFTDTRQDGYGKLFVALEGEKFDAHDFLDAAIAAGAVALCVTKSKQNKIPPHCPVPVLLTEDSLVAYQAIGRLHRRKFPDLKLVGITGSVGKTSVKEMLRAIFSFDAGEEKVLYTLGNTNNQIGVPQNLLRLTPEHRYAVIEMGTNHPGEIEPLSLCTQAQTALVNSIAPCHLEFLGSLDGVAREKSRIFCGLPPNGTAVIPADCPGIELLRQAAAPLKTLSFGENSGDVRSHYRGGRLQGSTFDLIFPGGEHFTVNWRLAGRHQSLNAAAAAAVALSVGVAPQTIANGLEQTLLPGMRNKITQIDGVTYFNDAYNANPGSMQAAFEQLSEFANGQQLILILGEMLELGAYSFDEHREIFALAKRMFPAARIATVGKEFQNAGAEHHFNTAVEAQIFVKKARRGDLVFAKGSRGIAVEMALPEEAR